MVAGSCEHGTKHSDNIKGGEFLDYLRDCWFLQKAFVPYR